MPFYNPIWYRHKGKVTPTAFNYTLASIAIPANPNWSLERCGICFVTSPVFQVILSCCHADCMPVCPNLACYAFDKDSSKSARQQNEIVPDSNNRYGLNDFGGVSCVIAAEKTRQKSLSPEWSERPELTVTQTSVSRLSGIAKPSSARGSAYT